MSFDGCNHALIHLARSCAEQDVEMLLKEHQALFCSLANRLRCTWVTQEELIQAGRLGFIDALRHYDPSKEVKLTTYAVPWILGEMRRTMKRLETTACSLDMTMEDGCATLHDIIADPKELNLGWIDLRLAISKLNSEEQLLICLRYFRDKSQKESAALLGKSQTQVSRMERRALDALHAMLS
ncbi:MAG: sigma-70 family RNA polymerase sigma factor [Clostridia bacterium]|nr:sigma-70 family RNA polymerase sigma factor [Clostridia bacterium]